MKEKEAGFDSCRCCMLLSCCKITTRSEITVPWWSEIQFALTPFVKRSLLLTFSVKTGSFMSMFPASAFLENIMRFAGGGGRREGSWREGCNQTFAQFCVFAQQNSCSCTAQLQMCSCFAKGFLERRQQNINKTATWTYSVPSIWRMLKKKTKIPWTAYRGTRH